MIVLIACSYFNTGNGVRHNMITGVLPFFGTLVGAGVAFLSDRLKEDKRIEDGQVIAINKALLALFAQLNELANLNVEVERLKDAHPVNLGALAIPENLGHHVNAEELAFLVDHRHFEILSQLETEQRRFDASFFSLHDRNKLMVDAIHPKLAASGLNGEFVSTADIFRALGEYDYGRLITATKNVYANIPSTVESCPAVMDELTRIGKLLFPHRVILKFGGMKSTAVE